MANEKHTTVNLTEKAQLIKEDLAPVFGLKNILSGGLLLFGRLNSDEQKSTIAEANGQGLEPLKGPDVEFRRRVVEICQEIGVLRAEKKSHRRAKTPKP